MVGINTVVPRLQRHYVIVAGSATVGKTSLVQVLTQGVGNFPRSYAMTLGADVHTKTVPLSQSSACEFVLVDSAGDVLYQDFLTQIWPDNALVCLVYDVTKTETFHALHTYMDKLNKYRSNKYNGLLIGNKTDSSSPQTVDDQEANSFAKSHNLNHFLCSAKNNTNVFEAFKMLAQQFQTKK